MNDVDVVYSALYVCMLLNAFELKCFLLLGDLRVIEKKIFCRK